MSTNDIRLGNTIENYLPTDEELQASFRTLPVIGNL